MKDRDFNSISPSARSLLSMKGYTDIPFAREAAGLISEGRFEPDFNRNELTFWARVLHFENRDKSITQLLEKIPVVNRLELSSGFSFRGLDMMVSQPGHYIDTDLPIVIETKKKMAEDLVHGQLMGILEFLSLNALDKAQFSQVVDRFAPGEIVILNEGLLMYLEEKEKEQMCQNIRQILQKRGGYWITADIYVQGQIDQGLHPDMHTRRFFTEHRIEEKKFENFDAARQFFTRMGFRIFQKAEPDRKSLSSARYFFRNLPKERLQTFQGIFHTQETWCLQVF